ncbi:MAG: Asp-tRNA(Asn)/Glu-tRNA(Gln) amidotransferase subunit GatC [Clostridiales bacterium]|nr:Asp-tRNA(Asn)/Glu-tRNA(Gln) amidotransferase subunit GatC [Clostridiales bacterium]HBM81699.1 Asp-tRNA(Asn)/Glu-tRNA(Gln) amidotransferase GatCAB subunit C [Clostridiaceae bacterium]
MEVTIKDVQYVAELARLKFSEDKLLKFTKDLNDIVGYVDKLNELNTDDIPVSVNPVFIQNVFREDKKGESLNSEEVLKNAPDKQDGYFKVPKIIEG